MTDLKADEIIPSIIAAAVAAAGPMGNNEGAWKAKVNRAIPHITSMINENSRQWKTALEVLEASVFTGSYVRHEVEASSTRAVLFVDTGRASENYPEGIEPIRSHRTDNAAGRDMLARLERLEPGDELVLWRAMEKIEGTNKSVRTLVHLETRPKRTQSPAEVPPTRPAGRVERRDDDGHVDAVAPRPTNYSDEIDSERIVGWRRATLDRLSEAEMGKLNSALAKRGYDFYGVSEVEWVEVVRPLIRSIIDNEGK